MASYYPISEDHLLPQGTMLRRFALFVDGMARALFLPFGPELVYRILHGTVEITPTTWSSISFRLALTISIFLMGHSSASLLVDKLQFLFEPQNLRTTVPRLGGAAIALHFFSWGAGLSSVFFLLLIRFLYALIVGILYVITAADASLEVDPNSGKQPASKSDIGPETAKIYLAGFAVSSLTGGLSYHALSTNTTFQALTGTYLWSTVFFLSVTIVGEIALRGAFAVATQPEHLDRAASGAARNVRKVVRRIMTGKGASVKFEEEFDPETARLTQSPDGMRQRSASMNSGTDQSEYFDCNSFSEEGSLVDNSALDSDDEVAKYMDRKCCYADGSPAYVTQGNCAAIVPANYLEDCRGDRGKASKMWLETQKWRRERNVWRIHKTSNTFYYDIKKAYPHCPHGYSKDGYCVMYEMPGKMNLRALFRGECNLEDMVHHYIFFQEYVSNYICTSEELRKAAGKEGKPYGCADYGILVVMDIEGAGISMLSTDVIRYLTTVSAIAQAHYPQSMKRVCVVNCPWFASGVFPTIKKIMPASVKADLFSNNCIDGLRQYIDDDQIPPEYGGSSPYKFGEHPFAKKLDELVDLAAEGDVEAHEEPIVVSSPKDMVNGKKKDTLDAGTQQNDMPPTLNASIVSIDSDGSMRRRAVPISPVHPSEDAGAMLEAREVEKGGVGVDSLAFVSFLCAFWSGTQGAIEVAIGLWLSSPARFGGLGYPASTNGVTIFCAAVVLFALLATGRVSGLISHVPRNDPLRALRLGLAAESVILFLLAFLPIKFSADDTVVNLTASILLAMGALASILGRSGATFLRLFVADLAPPSLDRSAASVFSADYLIAECTSGRAADSLSLIAEVVGAWVNSQIWSLSIDRDRPSKYDGSLCLFIPALFLGCMYFFSHFLRLEPKEKSIGPGAIEDGGTPRKAV